MLPANAEYNHSTSLLAATEPKMEQWLRQMMISPADICLQVVEDIETTLNKLFTNFDEYAWQGMANLKRVETEFSWKKKAEEYIAFITEIENKKKR